MGSCWNYSLPLRESEIICLINAAMTRDMLEKCPVVYLSSSSKFGAMERQSYFKSEIIIQWGK